VRHPKFGILTAARGFRPAAAVRHPKFGILAGAASFPGTKRICGNPSLFAGIVMIFSVIPGNPSGIEFLYQEKVFVAGRVSGNELLGSNS